eukprot:gene7747-10524_t
MAQFYPSTSTTILAVATTTTALVISLIIFRSSRQCKSSSPDIINKQKKPSEYEWLDQSSFDVVTAIVDTLIPAEPLITKEILESIIQIHFNHEEQPIFEIDKILKDELVVEYLRSGAVDLNTHINVVQTLTKMVPKGKLQQLYFVLKALSTSFGAFILTGKACPFQDLPLSNRQLIMTSLKQSKLEPIRAIYLTFKRLTCNIFLSGRNGGYDNPSAKVMEYDPTYTVNKKNPSASEKKDEDDKYRKALEYELASPPALRPSKKATDGLMTTDNIAADVVVVGSGAGGGAVAHALVNAGYNVVVLEKGGYYRQKDFRNMREADGMLKLYENAGLVTTEDANIIILAGSCVGGGTTVNWSASFDTPEGVREEWVKKGLHQFRIGGEFDDALKLISNKLSVNSNFSHRSCDGLLGGETHDTQFAVNYNNQILWEGAESLGYKPEKIPRNVTNCVDCGNCPYGCPYGSKQSTITALLEPLLDCNHHNQTKSKGSLRIIPECKVTKILTEPLTRNEASKVYHNEQHFAIPTKKAVGVESFVVTKRAPAVGNEQGEILEQRRLIVKAKIVVSSAGSLHTPALLLRSGFNHPKIGRHLALHPVVGSAGFFSEHFAKKMEESGASNSSSSRFHTYLAGGVGMGVVIKRDPKILMEGDSPSPLNEVFPGVIETPPVHPGISAMVFPCTTGLVFKLYSLLHKRMAVFISIPRDISCSENRIVIDERGEPLIYYKLTKQDTIGVMEGLEMSMRLMKAAGVSVVILSHHSPECQWIEIEKSNDKKFEKGIQTLKREGLQSIHSPFFSAHQMSSCRMSATAADGPVKPSGETFECCNMFVADGSVLPTSLGINPMVTIEAISLLIAGKISKRLELLG